MIAHAADGQFDLPALIARAAKWPGLEGMDLAKLVTRSAGEEWEGGAWTLGKGYARSPRDSRPHVVAMDFGAKDNIFRNLVKAGAKVTVVPAKTPLDAILAMKPAGVFLSNGPGDPEGVPYLVESVRGLIGKAPIFGICLGNQILAHAYGGKTSGLVKAQNDHPAAGVIGEGGQGLGEQIADHRLGLLLEPGLDVVAHHVREQALGPARHPVGLPGEADAAVDLDILPGAVDTPMLRAGLGRGHVGSGDVQDRLDNLARKTVNGRVGTPAEIASAIYFLADNEQSSFMTGQAMIVDGGATARLSTE